MFELVGLAAGMAWGLAGYRLRGALPWWAFLAGAAATGVGVSMLAGELAESWAFALFDAAQVVAAALATRALATAFDRRRRLRMQR